VANEIPSHYKDMFKGHVEFMLSQKKSVLRGSVIEEPMTGKQMLMDDFGETELEEKTTRFAPTPVGALDHFRRAIHSRTFDKAILTDWQDVIRVMSDPTNKYVQKVVAAMNRKIDDVIIGAFEGTAYTGETGVTPVAFDTSMIVDVQVRDTGVGAADLGLNSAKILAAKELLDAEENDENEERYMFVRARQMTSLLKSEKTTSSDYAEIKALVTGKINAWAGFKFIKCPDKKAKVDANGDDKVYYWTKSGIMLAMAKEPTTKIDERADLSYATQVYGAIDGGATRMNEKKVGYIECDPTAGPGK